MESKRKNVYIVLFVITTIVAGCLAVYFGIMRNKDVRNLESKIDEILKENDENKIAVSEEKDIKKQLIENKELEKETPKELNVNSDISKKVYFILNSSNQSDNFVNENGVFNGFFFYGFKGDSINQDSFSNSIKQSIAYNFKKSEDIKTNEDAGYEKVEFERLLDNRLLLYIKI